MFRILTCWEQTSWVCTSATMELNQGLLGKNPATWRPNHSAAQPLGHPAWYRSFSKGTLTLGSLSSNNDNGTATVTQTLLENEHLGIKWWLFCDYYFFLASFIVDRARCKWTVRSAACWSKCREWEIYCCLLQLKLWIWKVHVVIWQQDYFSSFSQSDHCFLASSLSFR